MRRTAARLAVCIVVAAFLAACAGQKTSQHIVQHPGTLNQHGPLGESFVTEVTHGPATVYSDPFSRKVATILPGGKALQVTCYVGRTKTSDGRTIELYYMLGGGVNGKYILSDNFTNQAYGPRAFPYDPAVPKCSSGKSKNPV